MTHDEHEHRGSEERDALSSSRIDDGDVSALESALQRRREPYARATVVRREPPASANVGDRAVVTADGEIHGWIGGVACAQSVVSRVGTDVIESGTPTLVGIAPDTEDVDRPGLEAFPMTCHSDGVLELFVEPVASADELVIVGGSAVAQSLARLAAELALDVTLVTDDDAGLDVPETTAVRTTLDPGEIADAVGPAPIVVVASMGEYDGRGIAAGVLAEAPYVGVVASSERADTEIERAAGHLDRDPEEIAPSVTNPAGIDIEAYTPTEIAVSLLAEIVDVRGERGADGRGAAESESDDAPAEAIDPVCGMAVDPSDPPATVEHAGETYYFCCRGCADDFEIDPASYLDGEAVSP